MTKTAVKTRTSTKKKPNYYAKWYYLKNKDKLNKRAKEYYHNVKKAKREAEEAPEDLHEKQCHCFFCTHEEAPETNDDVEDAKSVEQSEEDTNSNSSGGDDSDSDTEMG